DRAAQMLRRLCELPRLNEGLAEVIEVPGSELGVWSGLGRIDLQCPAGIPDRRRDILQIECRTGCGGEVLRSRGRGDAGRVREREESIHPLARRQGGNAELRRDGPDLGVAQARL